MTLSLLGIIAVQVFWMRRAILEKEQQLDSQINEALHRTAYLIERNRNAYLLSNFKQMQLGHVLHKNSSNNSLNDFMNFWHEIYKDKHLTKTYQSEESSKKTTYSLDTTIVTGNTERHIRVVQTNSASNNVNKQFEQTTRQIKQHLSGVIDQMALEFSLQGAGISENLVSNLLEPTLRSQLKNLGINLNFEYAITNSSGQSYKNMKSDKWTDDNISKAYKTTLFPNDIMGGRYFLQVFFPEKRSIIYSSLIWLFIGSVVFTLIIIITFFYTLRTIFNQKHLSEMKSDFINNMTHEFKTPIATISLATDAISNPMAKGKPEQVSRFLQVIREENKRMNRQVENVLQMAMLDKKDFNLNCKPIYVHSLISQAVKNISLQVEQKGGTIIQKLEATTDLLNIDENHFTNIIYNLLDNANKYTIDKEPKIEVSTYSKQGYFYIDVSDNGMGMDKETQTKVFDKFFRYSMGNVHTIKGFGLGLSYVKGVVKAFGGEIDIKSVKGKGSTFTVKIPF